MAALSQESIFDHKKWVRGLYVEEQIVSKLFDIESTYLRPTMNSAVCRDVEFMLTLINEMYTELGKL